MPSKSATVGAPSSASAKSGPKTRSANAQLETELFKSPSQQFDVQGPLSFAFTPEQYASFEPRTKAQVLTRGLARSPSAVPARLRHKDVYRRSMLAASGQRSREVYEAFSPPPRAFQLDWTKNNARYSAAMRTGQHKHISMPGDSEHAKSSVAEYNSAVDYFTNRPSVLKEDLVVWRGMQGPPQLSDKSFIATTRDPQRAGKYARDDGVPTTILRVLVPKGTPVMPINTWPAEDEILLPPGSFQQEAHAAPYYHTAFRHTPSEWHQISDHEDLTYSLQHVMPVTYRMSSGLMRRLNPERAREYRRKVLEAQNA